MEYYSENKKENNEYPLYHGRNYDILRNTLIEIKDNHKNLILTEFPGNYIYNLKYDNPFFFNLINKRFKNYIKVFDYNSHCYYIWNKGCIGLLFGF